MGDHWTRPDDGQGRSYLYTIFSYPYVLPEVRQTEDWRGQHLRSSAGPTAARPVIPPTFIFCIYLYIYYYSCRDVSNYKIESKLGSKFSTIVHGYDTEPSRIFTQQMQEWETRKSA
ncbi:hypothetical protein Tco_1447667 [Tanacetum coccineum]